MKFPFLASLWALVLVHPSPLYALDCTKASSPGEKLFCATPKLKKADEAMSAAYFKLLRETTDPEFHDALIRSQRRWLEVREHGPDRFGQAKRDTTDDREILFTATYDRMIFLQSGDPILNMEQQRKLRLKDSGGAFAGYKTSCVLQPPPYGSWNYECWGEALRQQNERICSSVVEWASGYMTEHRAVSVLKDGKPTFVATCSTGHASTSEQCPLPDGDVWNKLDGRWNTNPAASDNLPAWDAGDLWKYDPDISLNATDQRWMQDCLFAPTYPPSPETSRPQPGK
ncbi:lysozyme inhibitor LprI family protein [Bradyrhizobium sp. Cp5.3]|uniref:lysozyme inhibitor LprI family protein n=1 Tax=Bradyrhizobium sp. Cp5.3 TaxID=443598 RepID=UPI0004855698|nr:lysozyme inhibitor LprI family protein [Bradyrhizobium sp. Cp5.3]